MNLSNADLQALVLGREIEQSAILPYQDITHDLLAAIMTLSRYQREFGCRKIN